MPWFTPRLFVVLRPDSCCPASMPRHCSAASEVTWCALNGSITLHSPVSVFALVLALAPSVPSPAQR